MAYEAFAVVRFLFTSPFCESAVRLRGKGHDPTLTFWQVFIALVVTFSTLVAEDIYVRSWIPRS